MPTSLPGSTRGYGCCDGGTGGDSIGSASLTWKTLRAISIPPPPDRGTNTFAKTVLSPDGITVVVSMVAPSAPRPTSATRSLIVTDPRYVSSYSAHFPSGTLSRSIADGMRGGQTANGSSADPDDGAIVDGFVAAHAAIATVKMARRTTARSYPLSPPGGERARVRGRRLAGPRAKPPASPPGRSAARATD